MTSRDRVQVSDAVRPKGKIRGFSWADLTEEGEEEEEEDEEEKEVEEAEEACTQMHATSCVWAQGISSVSVFRGVSQPAAFQ